MTRWIAIAAVAATLFAGCGSGGSANDEAATPSSPTTSEESSIEKDARYGSVEDLKEAAVAAGYTCANWRVTNVVKLAAESGNCSDEDVFTTYASDGDLQSQLDTDKVTAQLLMDNDIDPNINLVGPNWMIRGLDEEVRPLQEDLGGTIVDPAG